MTTSICINSPSGVSLPIGPQASAGNNVSYWQMLTFSAPEPVQQGVYLNAVGAPGQAMNSPFVASSGMLNGGAGPPANINATAYAAWAASPQGLDFINRGVVTAQN